MKLKNKQTGEIVTAETYRCGGNCSIELVFAEENQPPCEYNSLAELCDEWEDYEEPKGYWYIRDGGNIDYSSKEFSIAARHKAIGNKFETKEEAEKALEKLKAWKRLKDKGFRFEWWKEANGFLDYNKIAFNHFAYITDDRDQVSQDLDLLFGSKE